MYTKIFGTLGAEDRHGLDGASVQVQACYAKDGSVYAIRFKKKTIQTSYTQLGIQSAMQWSSICETRTPTS
jgi:hypothetical protein